MSPMTRLLLVGALAIIATIIWAGGYGIFKDEVERREAQRTPTPSSWVRPHTPGAA